MLEGVWALLGKGEPCARMPVTFWESGLEEQPWKEGRAVGGWAARPGRAVGAGGRSATEATAGCSWAG